MSHCSNARKIPLFTGIPLTCRCDKNCYNLLQTCSKKPYFGCFSSSFTSASAHSRAILASLDAGGSSSSTMFQPDSIPCMAPMAARSLSIRFSSLFISHKKLILGCKLRQKSRNLQEISGKSFNFLSNIYLFSEILCYLFIKKGISEQTKTLNLNINFRDK